MQRGGRRRAGILVAAVWVAATSGCATVAELRKLEDRVVRMERSAASGAGSGVAMADAAAEIDALRREIQDLRGRVEVAEKIAADARVDARKARTAAVEPTAEVVVDEPETTAPLSEEMRAYREAYAAARSGNHQLCVDKFGAFLQTYPESSEADDAMYWMADCLFKSGDYKYAVLRFDDVVNKYPDGDKAPDALFRQGEALLQLGPSYHGAAIKAFERLLSEYPDSPLAEQARRRLDAARAG